MEKEKRIGELIILIRGAGEMATGVAHRLFRCHFRVCMLEIPKPLAVRREVSFCEAVYEGEKEVEGVRSKFISDKELIQPVWEEGKIPLFVDPEGNGARSFLHPDVFVDAALAKRNLGTRISDADLVIGLGPGFVAGKDVHAVVETNRGQNLGKVLMEGAAEPDTGIPGEVGGYTVQRVLRTQKKGTFHSDNAIGTPVSKGNVVAVVDDYPVMAEIGGVLRGIIRNGTIVTRGMKVGDIDPRGKRELCFTISEKARAIGGGVVEAILNRFNRPE
jgi:xanthine dehydrogenase accessory factor